MTQSQTPGSSRADLRRQQWMLKYPSREPEVSAPPPAVKSLRQTPARTRARTTTTGSLWGWDELVWTSRYLAGKIFLRPPSRVRTRLTEGRRGRERESVFYPGDVSVTTPTWRLSASCTTSAPGARSSLSSAPIWRWVNTQYQGLTISYCGTVPGLRPGTVRLFLMEESWLLRAGTQTLQSAP